MKIYHDHNEDDSWTEITTIAEYPSIKQRLDETTQINFVLNDFEGALYSTWEGYNFIPIRVDDDATNILFRGFLTNKKFTHNKLHCIAHGLGVKFDWTPMNYNYILSQGLIKTVPYAGTDVTGLKTIVRPNATPTQNWSDATGGNAHSTYIDEVVVDPAAGETDYCGFAKGGDDGTTDIHDMTTNATISTVTEVTIHCYGNDTNQTLLGEKFLAYISIDGVNWEVAKNIFFDSASNVWKSETWTTAQLIVGDWTDININSLQVKLISAADMFMVAGDHTYLRTMYLELTYTGSSDNAIEVQTTAEGLFGWGANYWTNDRDVAMLIVDNTNTTYTRYTASAIAQAGGAEVSGDNDSCDTAFDSDSYICTDTGTSFNLVITPTIDGANIATTLVLEKIVINYRIAKNKDKAQSYCTWSLEIDDDGTPVVYPLGILEGGVADAADVWMTNTITITGTNAELADYLVVDGANYDAIDGIRVKMTMSGGLAGTVGTTKIDLLTVDIYHTPTAQSTIMEKITENGDEWLYQDTYDWDSDTTVNISDLFKIGENTNQILQDIADAALIPITSQTTLTKYIAQNFKGVYCKEVLKQLCLVEGLHWWEDFTNYQIIISAEADFVDSTEDLTSTNYAYNWEFDDDCNEYGAVEVYGSAAYNIYWKETSSTSTSPRTKSIIEETIMTLSEAEAVAVKELAELESKRPSIKIPLKGVYNNITVGKTVGLTMERPTVGAADYPIRMIERNKLGADIYTTIYCGLGHSTPTEKIAGYLNKALYTAHKAHTDRLISTPFAAGATFVWSDIGGAEAAVDSIIAGTDHTTLANPNGEAEEQHMTSAQIAALHATYTDGEADARIALANHTVLQNPNGEADEQHLTAAQVAALHVIYNDAAAVQAVEDAGLILAAAKVITSADEDLAFIFGRASTHSPINDVACFSHKDNASATDYAIKQLNAATGYTYVNSKTAGKIILANNNVSVGDITNLGLQMGGGGGRISTFDIAAMNDSDTKVPTNRTVMEYVTALIAAEQDTLELYVGRLADGCLWNSTGVGSLLSYPAADSSCSCEFNGIMPVGWAAMTNPVLHFAFLSTANDTWAITTKVNSATFAEAASGNNLYNAVGVLTTAGAAMLWHEKELSLTGTISPGDMVGCRIYKTSADAQILYLHPIVWITRT